MKARFKFFAIAVIVGATATGVHGLPQGGTIAPATVQEIMGALGPDADGLAIPADKIPDIFALTASRLDEDSKKFIVQGSYMNGRWKGGKAVIEYARDLSYTQVSVYDKGGHRQRIYSVASRSSSPPATANTNQTPQTTAETMEPDQPNDTPVGDVPVTDDQGASEATPEKGSAQNTSSSGTSSSSSKKKSHHKSTTTVATTRHRTTTTVASASMSGFVWDESLGTYVAVKTNRLGQSAVVSNESTTSAPASSKSTSRASSAQAPEETPAASTSSRSSKKVKNVPATRASKQSPQPTSDETSSTPAAQTSDDTWVPDHLNGKKSKKTKKTTTANSPSSTGDETDSGATPPSSGKATSTAGYVWDDSAGAYVPAAGASSPGTSASNSSASSSAQPSGSSKKSKKKKHQDETTPEPTTDQGASTEVASNANSHSNGSTPTSVASDNTSVPVVASNTTSRHRKSSKQAAAAEDSGTSVPVTDNADSDYTLRSKPVDTSIPSTEDLLSQPAPSNDNAEPAAATPKTSSKKGSKNKKSSAASSENVVVAQNTTTPPPAASDTTSSTPDSNMTSSSDQWASHTKNGIHHAAPDDTTTSAPPSRSAPAASVPAPATDENTSSAHDSTLTTGADQWASKTKNGIHHETIPDEAAQGAASGTSAKAAKGSGDDMAPAEGGADMPGIDTWKPKKGGPAPAVDEKLPANTVQVAMVPKPAAEPASIDSLLKIAAAGEKSNPSNGSDQWAPKSAVLPKPDVDIDAEIQRVRNAPKPAPPPVVKLKHDINNPEEGVLPVNSFEKFSGPRYGRHWEYERRLKLEKKSDAPIQNYDFYVDEVDRKKEIHNIYYYQHSKGNPIPKLIAVEKHDHVTFMSNYDVDKENKGKVSKM